MLIGITINAIGVILLFRGLYVLLDGGGFRLLGASFAVLAVGTAVYYIARFFVWLHTGQWDNTGIGKRNQPKD